MLSETYQQATEHPQIEKLRNLDPDNHLLAYRLPRRLTAEELRDGMLVSTGELNRHVGGLPVMPEINMEVALQPRMIQFSLAPAYQPSVFPKQRNRRTLYAYRVASAGSFSRALQPTQPQRFLRRTRSRIRHSTGFLASQQQPHERPGNRFGLAFGKGIQGPSHASQASPSTGFWQGSEKDEWDRLENYVEKMRKYHLKHEPEKTSYPTSITRSLVEEATGQPFEYGKFYPLSNITKPIKNPTR